VGETMQRVRKTLLFPTERVDQLYEYIVRKFNTQDGLHGTYNNAKQKYIGFFGHVKLMEALIFLYQTTKKTKYLEACRKKIEFCMAMRRETGIDDWWSKKYNERSDWFESNHLGILALVVYEYYKATGDSQFNQLACELMNKIPKVLGSGGAYVDGYNPDQILLDDRCYLADNAEILIGWWACWKMTGKKEYMENFEGIFDFIETQFKTIPTQPDLPAWLVGPKHIPYAEGTDAEFCDTSHTTYSQFFIARDIVLTGRKDQYRRLVQSTDWAIRYTLFPDHLIGYNRLDDKMVGWSAYFAVQCYWAYLITGNDNYFRQAQKTMDTIWSLQHKKTGKIIPTIAVTNKINWREIDQNRAGLGEIWQLTAILESAALLALSGSGVISVG
jgi:hypothetical protein